MQYFLSSLPTPTRTASWSAPDPLIVGSTAHVIGRDEHILGKTLRPGNGKKK